MLLVKMYEDIYIFIMHTRFCRFYMISVFFVVGSLQICTNTELTKLSYLSRYWYKLLKPANSGGSFPRNIPKDGATLLIRAGRSKSLELAILCLAMYLGSIGWESNVHILIVFLFLTCQKKGCGPVVDWCNSSTMHSTRTDLLTCICVPCMRRTWCFLFVKSPQHT